MLYDQNQGVRAQLLALRDWASEHHPEEKYNWQNGYNCFFCQYHKQSWDNIDLDKYGRAPNDPEMTAATYIGRGGGDPIEWTFGGAIDRIDVTLEALMAA